VAVHREVAVHRVRCGTAHAYAYMVSNNDVMANVNYLGPLRYLLHVLRSRELITACSGLRCIVRRGLHHSSSSGIPSWRLLHSASAGTPYHVSTVTRRPVCTHTGEFTPPVIKVSMSGYLAAAGMSTSRQTTCIYGYSTDRGRIENVFSSSLLYVY